MSHDLVGPLVAVLSVATLGFVLRKVLRHPSTTQSPGPITAPNDQNQSPWDSFNDRVEQAAQAEKASKAKATGRPQETGPGTVSIGSRSNGASTHSRAAVSSSHSQTNNGGDQRRNSNEGNETIRRGGADSRPEALSLHLPIQSSDSPSNGGEISPASPAVLPIRARNSLELVDAEELAIRAQTSPPQPQVIQLQRTDSKIGLKASDSLENLQSVIECMKHHSMEPQPVEIQLQRTDSRIGLKASDSLENLQSVINEMKHHLTEPQPLEFEIQRTDSKLGLKASDSLENLQNAVKHHQTEPQPRVIQLQRNDSKLGLKATDSLEYLQSVVEHKRSSQQVDAEPQPRVIQLQKSNSLGIKANDSLERLHQSLQSSEKPQPRMVVQLTKSSLAKRERDDVSPLQLGKTREESEDSPIQLIQALSKEEEDSPRSKSSPATPSWLRGKDQIHTPSGEKRGTIEGTLAETSKGSGFLAQRGMTQSPLGQGPFRAQSPTHKPEKSHPSQKVGPNPLEIKIHKQVANATLSPANLSMKRRSSEPPVKSPEHLKVYERMGIYPPKRPQSEDISSTSQVLGQIKEVSLRGKRSRMEEEEEVRVMGGGGVPKLHSMLRSPSPSVASSTFSSEAGPERTRTGAGLKRISKLVQSGFITAAERRTLKSLLFDGNEQLLALLEDKVKLSDDDLLAEGLRRSYLI